jgi:hypothetical protein
MINPRMMGIITFSRTLRHYLHFRDQPSGSERQGDLLKATQMEGPELGPEVAPPEVTPPLSLCPH